MFIQTINYNKKEPTNELLFSLSTDISKVESRKSEGESQNEFGFRISELS